MVGPETWLKFFIYIIVLQEGAQLSRHYFFKNNWHKRKIWNEPVIQPVHKDLDFGFLIRGLITASLYDFGMWPKDNDEFIILRSSSSATGDNSFSNLGETGSNKHVVGLDAVISLFSSSCPIVVKRLGLLA